MGYHPPPPPRPLQQPSYDLIGGKPEPSIDVVEYGIAGWTRFVWQGAGWSLLGLGLVYLPPLAAQHLSLGLVLISCLTLAIALIAHTVWKERA